MILTSRRSPTQVPHYPPIHPEVQHSSLKALTAWWLLWKKRLNREKEGTESLPRGNTSHFLGWLLFYICVYRDIYRHIHTYAYVQGLTLIPVCIHIYGMQGTSRWLSHSLLLENCLGNPLFRAGRRRQQKAGCCSGATSAPQHTEIPVQSTVVQTYGGADVPSVRKTRRRQRVQRQQVLHRRGEMPKEIHLQRRPSQKKTASVGRSS